MKIEDAFQVINQLANKFVGTRQEHLAIQEAIATLQKLVDNKTMEATKQSPQTNK